MPLCSKGLWLAEMTMPASAPLRTVRYATAGVGSTPKGITSPPTEQMPQMSAASSISEEMRVSLPMVMRGALPFSSFKTAATA